MSSDGKISCQVCGARIHSVQIHLKEAHPEMGLDQYKESYPLAELLSPVAKEKIDARRAELRVAAAGGSAAVAEVVTLTPRGGIMKRPMHEVFGLGAVKAAMNARGEPIMISTVAPDPEFNSFVPDKDGAYVFSIDLLKTVAIGFELGKSIYLWGYHGTGKTTMLEQYCAYTGRPFLRVQHSIGTEESHIVGQTLVKDGATYFELGPLPYAMLNGLVYCADEYDFAMPSVLAVYQAVLEGKPLVIKEAPPELRVIRPHPNFRFTGTGNTNGGGDETGLYQGTQMQNTANYSRFGIVEEVEYMPEKQEIAVISGKAGVDKADAKKLVEFAKEVRAGFKAGRIGSTISPRELINAAELGLVRGSQWKEGLRLAFTNRLSRVDKETVMQFAQRVFG